ncbi:linamarin synthase 2-like [Senna tora]|uniref:Linamarin synthase 2-like n=1 Tax=Senna tora TaxID=362788 RepID=A0A834X8Q3_9FABA|nr:linamarin synthase 2-like [Senna tora]
MPIHWIPCMKNLRLKDIPSFIRITDLNDTLFDFMGSEAQNCLKSSSIIISTFRAFEHEALNAIIKAQNFPNIYTIGPLPLLYRHVSPTHLPSLRRPSPWKEDTACLNWLDQWEPSSVVYVNYGSWTVITENHLREFAWGLANSEKPFLWILRSDVIKGIEESSILPKGFRDEIEGRGYITSWCPQEKVLEHPAIGVFLTHCGWNSITEAVCGGVPIIGWPFFAEQQMNCTYACENWKIGMEMKHDVKREEIAWLVKEMVEGEKGRELKKNVLEWKKKAKEATEFGGSSFCDFNRFIKERLHF